MRWIQFLVALVFLVIIHELGHFLFAKLFHVRVEKFYMFFNPRISIVRFKKLNGHWCIKWFAPNVEDPVVEVIDPETGETKLNKKGEKVYRPMTDEERAALPEDDWRREPDSTEWGIGWLPLGGYCSIGGMVDETKSLSDLPAEPQAWEFRSKPAWQRMFIILGGIMVNFVAAFVIFIAMMAHWGIDTLPLSKVESGFWYSELLQEQGFEQHDKILTIDGKMPEELSDVVQALIIEGKTQVVVLRGEDTVALTMTPDLGTRYLALQNETDRLERQKQHADKNYRKAAYVLIAEHLPFVVDSVLDGNAAAMAGLQAGDSIVAINGVETPCYVEVQQQLRMHPCDSIEVAFYRSGKRMTTGMFIGDQGLMGVQMKSKYDFYPTEHTDYNILTAIPAGCRYAWDMLLMYVRQFHLVFTKEGAQSVGGFGAISNMFPNVWHWYSFWHMTGFLSLILAFMNFIPIPGLDGGYFFFILVEMITRHKPSDKFLEMANNIGFWLLMALLLFANGNDIFKAFF